MKEAARRFEETKHLLRWELPLDSSVHGTPVKRSLAELDRTLLWAKDQAKFIGQRRVHWDERQRNAARLRIEQLSRQRELLLDRIEAERAALTDQVTDKAEFVATLYQIQAKEEQRRQHEHPSEARKTLAPRFTLEELKELDAVASRLRDPDFYRALTELERQYDARSDEQNTVSDAERAARAQARAILAELNLRAADAYLARFSERRDQIDLIVHDDGGRNITLARLAESARKAPLARAFRASDERVVAAVEAYGQRLAAERQQAAELYGSLSNEARTYEAEMARTNPEQSLPEPRFTNWEISKLELHAARETDPVFRTRYEKFYRDALEQEYEGRARTILIEKDADSLLEPVSATHQQARDAAPQLLPASAPKLEHQHEMTFER